MEGADFSGYATKAGLKCSDGRIITPEAFKHMDKVQVPLVWSHGHNSSDNVLGHAVLEAKNDGVYAWGFFNDTPQGVNVKKMVLHKDITAMSIYANQIVEKLVAGSKSVLHGMIREVSLVLSGANPGAVIDWIQIAHGDGDVETLTDEAIIHTGLDIVVESDSDTGEDVEHQTVQELYDTLNADQKGLVHYMIAAALGSKTIDPAQHSDGKADDNKDGKADENKDNNEQGEGDLKHKEGSGDMTRNVFEQKNDGKTEEKHTLSHTDIKGIFADAMKPGNTLKSAVHDYAITHGITNIDVLFPDAKTLTDRPEFNQRRMEWVGGVINGTRHSPFSRIKTVTADLTQDEARAKGYITGSYKKEEWFGVTARVTTPTTIYKKQKLDRDDIVDITDFDVVAWLKMEMRMMLEEELARAILIGDGRDPGDDDKIKDPGAAAEGAGIRAIMNEHELFATTVNVNIGDASSSYTEVIESVLRARKFYKGTGSPTFYTTETVLVEMLLLKDTQGRRLYNSQAELEAALRVSAIVPVEVMEDEPTLVGIIVNLADYNVGADRGGEINLFDDFDIDYNQYKYLIETRVSGALTKIKSALVIRKTTSTNVLVDPITSPTFVPATGVVTIPTQTGVVYKNEDTNATLTAGAQTALSAGATLNVIAVAASGYYFATNAEDEWSFTRPAA